MKKLFVLLFTLLFVFQSAHVLVYANSDITENDMIESQETVPSNNTTDTAKRTATAYFNCDTSRFLVTDTICATLHISQPLEDSQISYDNDGFTIEQVLKVSDTSYSIQLKMQQVSAATLNVHLFNEEDVCASFSAISTDKGVFVSPISIHEAWRAYYYSEVEDGIYTISEFHKIMSEYAQNLGGSTASMIETLHNFSSSDTSTMGVVLPMPTITVSGTIRANFQHNLANTSDALKYMYVELYEIEQNSESLLYSGYTNGNGRFQITHLEEVNGLINLRLKVYSKGEYASVYDSNNNLYCYVFDFPNCNLGADISISALINTDVGDSLGQSIQVAQVLIYATKYTKANLATVPPVSSIYPVVADNSYYNNQIIYLVNECYSDWEVILHEYGHHIQLHLGLDNIHVGGDHEVYLDLEAASSYSYDKLKAVHLAWHESVASMLGEIIKQHYASSISSRILLDHPYVAGVPLETLYDQYNGFLPKGEACEGRICGLLWDIYDDENESFSSDLDTDPIESFDELSLGGSALWDLLTMQVDGFEDTLVATLSDFCSYFLEVYPEYLEDFSALLSHHGIGASNVTITNHANGSQTISWIANGMVNLPNNYFGIAIVDNTTSEVLYQAVAQNCNVLLSPSTVNNLESHSYYIIIFAYQINDLITTGPYTCYYNIS